MAWMAAAKRGEPARRMTKQVARDSNLSMAMAERSSLPSSASGEKGKGKRKEKGRKEKGTSGGEERKEEIRQTNVVGPLNMAVSVSDGRVARAQPGGRKMSDPRLFVSVFHKNI